jgi:hypothetical protein
VPKKHASTALDAPGLQDTRTKSRQILEPPAGVEPATC